LFIGKLLSRIDLVGMIRPGIGQLGSYAPRPVVLEDDNCDIAASLSALPKLSIVVPSLNQGAFIGGTLQSILEQRYPNLELIIVDGGSTDNTLSIIKQYEQHVSWWVSESDKGQASAINKGFKQATGDILAWINSDDKVAPGAFRFIAGYFAANPHVHAVYGDRIVINEKDFEIGRWILPDHSPGALKWFDYVPQETLYWTREAWELAGESLDESLKFAMDWDFLLRLTEKRAQINHVSRFLGLFRVHQQQKTISQISELGFQEMRELRRRALGYQPTRLQFLANIATYLIRARWREISVTMKIIKKVN